MQAECNNADCEKGTWNLRKKPHEYARGAPSCPECGTSRVTVHGAEQQQSQQQEPGFDRMESTQNQGQPAAQVHPQGQSPTQVQGQQQGGQLANPEEEMQQSLAQGAELGDVVHMISSGDPSERTVARGKLLQTAGMALAQYGQRSVKKDLEQQERAKQASNDDIQVSDDYVDCPECGTQLTGIPANQEFSCPSCGIVLEFSV